MHFKWHCIISIYYYVSNKRLPEECDKGENLEVTVVATTSPAKKKIVKRFVQCHVFAQSPICRHPNDKYPVKPSHAPDLCKNVSLEGRIIW